VNGPIRIDPAKAASLPKSGIAAALHKGSTDYLEHYDIAVSDLPDGGARVQI
jgi:hypothetical protein